MLEFQFMGFPGIDNPATSGRKRLTW